MEYLLLLTVLTFKSWEASSITQPVRNFRRHTGPPPPNDWELGLREAVHQALLREHHTEPALREHILEAPFLGKQNTASPFGDVAVLARGQLYLTPEGYKFVQDADCGCHGGRCVRSHRCQVWNNLGHYQKLLALWTVKRIRHRDPHYGHVYETEYTISPITSAISEDLVKRHGFFNYNVPGHIFVIKSDPKVYSEYHLNANGDKWYKKQENEPVNHFKESGSGHFKQGIVIGVSPDGYKHVLHSFPGFYSSYRPQMTYHDQTTIDPKEYELYKKLIESLAAKTTPHRFTVTTPKGQVPTYATTFIPTTLVQFAHGQIVPILETTLPPTTQSQSVLVPATKPITTLQSTQITKYSEPDLYYHTLPPSFPTPEPPKPITMPMTTTVHYYSPIEEPEPPIPTTRKTTTPMEEESDYDIFTTKPVQRKTTTRKITKATLAEPINTSTEPMRPVTEIPKQTYPDSINEQLPAPDKEAESTIPYIETAVTQPSTVPRTTAQTTTQKLTSVFIPSTTHSEQPTTITRATTIQHLYPFTTSIQSTEKIATPEKLYTTTLTIPTTTDRSTTLIPTTFGESTKFYTTSETVPLTGKTSVYTQPTTVVEYSTIKGHTETVGSTIGTGIPSTIYYATASDVPITQTVKQTTPTTTMHYYYFETELPKTSTIATDGTTATILQSTTTIPTTKTISSSTVDDFLANTEIRKEKTSTASYGQGEIDEDDIFGAAPKSTAEIAKSTTKLPSTQSDVAEALFGGGRRAKQLKVSSKIRRKPKVIYKNFFSASTEKPSSSTAEVTEGDLHDVTTEFKPYTVQSFSTSISVEINKRNSSTSAINVEPTLKAKLKEVVRDNDYKIYKAEHPQETTTEEEKVETKKVFDNVALQLVNHARSIDYLNKKPTKQTKYKRRNYSTKTKRQHKTNNSK